MPNIVFCSVEMIVCETSKNPLSPVELSSPTEPLLSKLTDVSKL